MSSRLPTRFRSYDVKCRFAGFTLIEMLVSLVIFSISITVLSSALFQSGRMLTIVEHGSGSLIGQWRIAKGLEEAIANIVVKEGERDATPPFRGDKFRFHALTYRHPLGAAGQVLPLDATLALVAQQSTNLAILDPTGKLVGMGGAPLALEFAFADSTGTLHDAWPARGFEAEVLPRAVVIRAASDGGALVAWWPYRGPYRAEQIRTGDFFGGIEAGRPSP